MTGIFSDLDRWVEVLYPANAHEHDNPAGLAHRPWELDNFVAAALAPHHRSDVAKAIRRCEPADDGRLIVPQSLLIARAPRALRILERCGRIRPDASIRSLDAPALAHVRLGARERGLGKALFPRNDSNHVLDKHLGPESRRAIGVALGCASSLSPRLATQQAPPPPQALKSLAGRTCENPLALRDYGRERGLALGLKRCRCASPTLHRILWGATSNSAAGGGWDIRPWDAPTVGLPVRVSLSLFALARKSRPPNDWTPQSGPLTWLLTADDGVLRAGRRIQLGFNEESCDDSKDGPGIKKSLDWEIQPHPSYFLPFAAAERPSSVKAHAYALYCDILLLLTALDGGEQILDRLAESGAGSVPFEDRWGWRSRIHLPMNAWRSIEAVIRWADRPSDCIEGSQPNAPEASEDSLLHSVEHWYSENIGLEDFLCERVDIRLETKRDEETVRTVQPAGSQQATLPDNLRPKEEELADDIFVRIAQIAHWTDRSSAKQNFPRIAASETSAIMQQVARAFQAPSRARDGVGPQVVLLP